jgi:TRAP-type C4-dicarboxylate transport system substrate-binding protein
MKKAIMANVGFIFLLMALFLLSSPLAKAEAKSVELSFAGTFPPKASPYRKAFLPWSKEVEKRTKPKTRISMMLL